ncbi:MAG: hypothetical protein QGG40_13995 [Myxococcota bacterium]|nr:hypothetical protein [Myxococcota bacterium]
MHVESSDSLLVDFTCDLLAVGVGTATLEEDLAPLAEAFDGTLLDTVRADDFKGTSGKTAL